MVLIVTQTFAGVFGGGVHQAFMSAVLDCASGCSDHCSATRLQSDTETRGLSSPSSSSGMPRHVLLICYLYITAGFRHPGMYQKNPVHPPKKPHFYFNLILVYTLYATSNAIFSCF